MSKESAAQTVLKDPEAFGLALSVAADTLTHNAHAAWEYETVWEFLEDKGCLPGPEGRERLMAVTAIRSNPAHMWDASVFQCAIAALNGRVSTPEVVDECSIGELVWAVTEIGRITAHYDGHANVPYGAEPSVYAAVVCAHGGLVLLPPELDFCRDAFDALPNSGRERDLLGEVLNKLKAEDTDLDEDDPASVQARILREVGHYVSERRTKLDSTLGPLLST